MHELIDLRNHKIAQPIGAESLERFAETQRAIRKRSHIHWGEHCSECAFPHCYRSCSFYTPRNDLHCRRFENGFEDVEADGLNLTRVGFRKWAKMEGRGPVSLKPNSASSAGNTALAVARTALNTPVLSWRAKNALRRRWNDRQVAGSRGTPPDAKSSFVIEILNSSDQTVAFTLTFTPEEKTEQALFQRAFDLGPGYNRVIIRTEDIAALINLSSPHLIQIEPVGDTRPVVFFGVVDFVDAPDLQEVVARPPTNSSDTIEPPAKNAKCVVWDLDNTIWDGTLAEDGVENLTLRPDAVKAIRALDARGILHSIASKNDEDAGLAALAYFGIEDYFLAPQINWGPKSESVKRIAQRLDIGINSLIFIDDQPFERGEVSANCPSVECLPDTSVTILPQHDRLDVPVTSEASRRREMYREQDSRRTAESQQPSDYLSFLRSCNLHLEVLALDDENLTRAAELSERTNQLNFSGSRIPRAELSDLVGTKSGVNANLLRCKDRFGDYGIIGLVLVNWDDGKVTDFMMSCRVQRKKVEQAYFSILASQFRSAGAERLEIAYKKTPRNGASRTMLEELGFVFEAHESDDIGVYVRPLGAPWSDDDIVHVEVADGVFPDFELLESGPTID